MSLDIRHRWAVVALAAVVATATPAHALGVHASLQPSTITVNPGDVITVDVTLSPADAWINAFDAAIRFDPVRLAFVPAGNVNDQRGPLMTAACSNTFHRFLATSDSLAINLSLLCAGAEVNGPGVIYRVQFQALAPSGVTHVSLGPSTAFYNAGFFVTPLDVAGMDICVSNCATGVGEGDASPALAFGAGPNPWRAGPASFTFRLPHAGEVSLALLDVSGRTRLECPVRWFPAGAGVITLGRAGLASGMYFARLRTADGVRTSPIVLMR